MAIPARIQTEDRSLIRDTHSKALLNTDRDALDKHRAILRKIQMTDTLGNRVTRLEARIDNITEMLTKVLTLITPTAKNADSTT